MGLIKYKFSKYWRVKEEIKLKENVSCLLIFGNDKLLIPINKKLILLDIKNDKILISSDVSDSRINDLLKINENEFICSSGDCTIKFVQITIDFSGFIILKNTKIHSKEIIQAIKLKEDKLFASCSKDLSIKIWECDFKNKNSKELIRNTINSSIEVLSIFELPNGEIIYISKNGRLVFLELKNGEYFLIEAINGIKNGLHNSIFLVNYDTILVGTKRNVFLIDINNKAILENVIKYLEHFKDFEPKEIPKPFPEMADDQFFRSILDDDWTFDFLNQMKLEEAIETLNAANYLQIEGLISLVAAKLGYELTNCSVEEAKKKFQIEDDMTD